VAGRAFQRGAPEPSRQKMNVQEGVFTRTGSSNRPPEVLRQAVADLRATYRQKRSRLTALEPWTLSLKTPFPIIECLFEDRVFRLVVVLPSTPSNNLPLKI
jgi:hypothetical protein